MNRESISTGIQLRAGVISLLVLTLGYLGVTGISDLLRAWAFIISFAVCFVLMMQSIVDLFVWAFGQTARLFGASIGYSVRLFRRVFAHNVGKLPLN